MKNLHLILCMLILAGATGCIKDTSDNNNPISGKDEPITDFSTSQEVVVHIAYELPRNIQVEIYDQNPLSLDPLKNYLKNDAIEPIAKGCTDEKGALRVTLRLAAMASEIYVYSPDVCAPTLLSGKIEHATEITLTPANRMEPVAAKAASRAITNTEVYWKKWDKQAITFRANPTWKWDAEGTPNYLTDTRFEMDEKFIKVIEGTIPKGDALDPRFSALKEIVLSEAANVKLYFVSNSSARKNTLAYFTYTGEVPTQSEINKSATVLFPNLSNEALKAGDGVELLYNNNGTWTRSFPAGSKIGFILLVDAWEKGATTSPCNVMYSTKKYNRYDMNNTQIADRPQMAAFADDGNFVLTFEDLPWDQGRNSKNMGDFADDVFVLIANPDTALPEIEDGVEDPNKPVGLETTTKGYLAFEDLWPYKGDYDMNDITMQYHSTAYVSDKMELDGIVSTWTFCNNGGEYVNGFGIAYDFPASAVKAITIEATNNVEVPGVDLRAGSSYQIQLFNNATEIPSGTQFTVQIKFNKGALDAISEMKKATAPFNPFITVRDANEAYTTTPRKEVHLTNYKPTPLALSFNGAYGDDLSDPARGLYYIAATGYPFAIDLVGVDHLDIPTEGQCISDAFPRFKTWVESDRKEAKDWYVK